MQTIPTAQQIQHERKRKLLFPAICLAVFLLLSITDGIRNMNRAEEIFSTRDTTQTSTTSNISSESINSQSQTETPKSGNSEAESNTVSIENSARLTSDEAVRLVEIWLDNHPLAVNTEAIMFGENDDAYNVNLYQGGFFASVYVDKTTRELYILWDDMVSLDDWYYSKYGSSQNQNSGLTGTSWILSNSVGSGDSSTTISFDDNSFSLRVNIYEGMGIVTGTYKVQGSSIVCAVSGRDFSGFIGDNVNEFQFQIQNGNEIIYTGQNIGVISQEYAYRFILNEAGTSSQNQYSGEFLYYNVPISWLFWSSIDEIVNVFSSPQYDEYYEGGHYYGYGYGYGDIDIAFFFDERSREITHILVRISNEVTFGGVTLDKNRYGLVGILGEPVDEYWEGMEPRYVMSYLVHGYAGSYNISFELPDTESMATSFTIW
jgi:hypothetical protein